MKGIYPGGVIVSRVKHDITIRGVDRNLVVLDGRDQQANAIEIMADHVTVENMTAHDFTGNGFYWEKVHGYAGRYLTVWNVGVYGIYAVQSRSGAFDHDLVSWAGDAAFYVGECHRVMPCSTTSSRSTRPWATQEPTPEGTWSCTTSSSATAAGIFPNSYDTGEAPPPQQEATFNDNVVRDSGRAQTPMTTPLGGFDGIGIAIAGGNSDLVQRNTVTGSTRCGIAIYPTVQEDGTGWVPIGDRVAGNEIEGSGLADLTLAAGSGPGNCFEANRSSSTDPPSLAATPCPSGSEAVARELVMTPSAALGAHPERRNAPPYTAGATPPPQPTMPGAVNPGAGAAIAVPLGWALLGCVAVWRRERETDRSEELGRQGPAAHVPSARHRGVTLLTATALLATLGGGGTLIAAAVSARGVRLPVEAPATGPSAGPPGSGVPAPSLAGVMGTLVFTRLEGTASDISSGRGVGVVYTIDTDGTDRSDRSDRRTQHHASALVAGWIGHRLRGRRCEPPQRRSDHERRRIVPAGHHGPEEARRLRQPRVVPGRVQDRVRLQRESVPGAELHLHLQPGWIASHAAGAGHDPAWSPIDDRIAFQRLIRRTPTDVHCDLFVLDRSSGATTRLTQTPDEEQHPSWSPDGTRITFDSFASPSTPAAPGTPHPPARIYVMPADGAAAPVPITPETLAVDSEPRWISGGLIAFFTYGAEEGEGIGVVRDAGSRVAELSGRYYEFDLRP